MNLEDDFARKFQPQLECSMKHDMTFATRQGHGIIQTFEACQNATTEIRATATRRSRHEVGGLDLRVDTF